MFKVENISVFKGKTLRVDFEGHEPIFVRGEALSEAGIYNGAVVSEEAIETAVSENEFMRAKERALYLLDVRDYTFVELFKKLEPNYPEEICYRVLNRLCEIGCINDRRYAEKYARYLCEVKKFGFYRAREEMKKRGLPQQLISEYLEPFEETAVERITEIIERKYLKYIAEDSQSGKAKAKSALVRQGYSFSQISEALAEF